MSYQISCDGFTRPRGTLEFSNENPGPIIGGALMGGFFPLVGMTVVIALTALVVGAPGGAGYLVRELRLAGLRWLIGKES